MKMAFIIHNEHYAKNVLELLKQNDIDYFTRWDHVVGKGHGTDKGVILGLMGESPDTIDPDTIDEKLAALRTGKLYIQINSEKAPTTYEWGPKGTLWGWIFPAHETVGQNVPQQDHWFIPQLDTPSR